MSEQKTGGISAEMKKPKVRLIALGVAAALLSGFGAWAYVASSNTKQVDGQSNLAKGNTDLTGKVAGVTPEYVDIIKQDNQKTIEAAKGEGKSAIAKVVPETQEMSFEELQGRAAQKVEKNNPPAPPVESHGGRPSRTSYSEREMQEYQAAVKLQEDRMQRSLQDLAAQWGYLSQGGASAISTVTVSQNLESDDGSHGKTVTLVAGNLPKGANGTDGQCLAIRAGKTCYAELTTGLNSDDSMWASATILQCKTEQGTDLSGSVLSGMGRVNSEWSSGVQFEFSNLSSKKFSRSLAVKAISLDEVSNKPAVSSDKDSHMVSRMLAAGALGMSKGVNKALETGGRDEQLVNNENGQVVQKDKYTDKQIALMGLTESAVIASEPLQSMVNRPATHNIENGRTIGIYFMTDVNGDCQ
ncbi:hypothetical protein ACVVI9_003960 [Escherichia coli]|jgi:hypothetical protein|uniref:Conjugal transfer protein TraO n=1 Tax=Escherichia coli TaxID=562 RepID=A0A3L0VXX3_ECOLX|nr:hypothetical protein [Aeromonas caviae]MDU7313099.1 hypothetical protein [Aeromonas sp.]HAT2715841.1 hypothetical protein [Aeromonas hydrophila]MBL0436785.1 hypothetical protein [Aeromonas caviae]MDH1847975.1 hypothetical protein [Aeromonas caviae]MDX7853111.1 hypothetical protein [Aeromonas caviae]